MKKRIEERRRLNSVRRRRKKVLTLFAVIIAFVFLGTMCGRDIVRLKSENRALKKQLRLLNPGEILFTFDEEQPEEDAEEAEESREDDKDKDGDSDE